MKKIVIKLEKTSKINFWIMFISFQVLPAVMIVDMRTVNDLTSFGLTTFLVLWDILFFSRAFVTCMRTFTFTQEGCQVSICGYTKMYVWNELNTKRIVTYKYTRKEKFYKYCLELHKKKIKPLKVLPNTYCTCIHPFSFIYVYFGEKKELPFLAKSQEESQPDWHIDTTNTLISQLREWGIELEEITVKISGKN